MRTSMPRVGVVALALVLLAVAGGGLWLILADSPTAKGPRHRDAEPQPAPQAHGDAEPDKAAEATDATDATDATQAVDATHQAEPAQSEVAEPTEDEPAASPGQPEPTPPSHARALMAGRVVDARGTPVPGTPTMTPGEETRWDAKEGQQVGAHAPRRHG